MSSPAHHTAPDDIDLGFTARLVPHAAVVDVQGEQVVVGGPRQLVALNPTGAFIVQFLDGDGTLGDLAADIADALGADPDRIGDDVVEFVRTLARSGLIEGVASGNAAFPGLLGVGVSTDEVGRSLAGMPFTDFSGATRSLAEFAGRRVLLLNWGPGCGYCTRIAQQVGALEAPLRDAGVDLVVLTIGDEESNTRVLADGRIDAPVFVRVDGVPDPFGGRGTPAAMVLDEEGVVSRPVLIGADQVPRLLADLAGVDAADGTVPIDGVRYLPAPNAACGHGGGHGSGGGATSTTEWAGTRVFAFGDHHVGIEYDDDATADALDRLFPGARVEDARAPENFSVVLGAAPGESSSRSLGLLVRGGHHLVRSRSRARVLAGLLQHLTAELAGRPPVDGSSVRVDATAVVVDGRAVLLPPGLVEHDLQQVQPRFAAAGMALVDAPDALVDTTTAELVLPEPSVPFDAAYLAGLEAELATGAELPRVRPGRYPLAHWMVLRAPEATGRLSPGSALTACLGEVANLATMEATVAAVELLSLLLQRVPVSAVWYETPGDLVEQVLTVLA